MRLGLGSPNAAYDMTSAATTGVTGSLNLSNMAAGLGVTAARTSGMKLTTTDWKHQQMKGKYNARFFSWSLRGLGGVPFDILNPSYPAKYSLNMFKNKPSIAQLGLPFNDDGSVTFTDGDYGKPITWRLSPELDGKDVAWSIFADVYLTTLWRCTGKGRTLKFTFGGYLHHQACSQQKAPPPTEVKLVQ